MKHMGWALGLVVVGLSCADQTSGDGNGAPAGNTASAGTLLDGVKLDPFYDRTDLVGITLRTVGHNLLEGAVLVTLVLFVFLLDLRAALVVATLIPLSLLTSFIYLHLRGMSANLLSMGAVDFGIIVDGGVVIIEAILARLAL